jgi:hypothetical protein
MADLGVVLVVINRIGFAPCRQGSAKTYARLMKTAENGGQGAYLIPWLADYCYLAFTFPERGLVLTMSRTSGKSHVFETPEFRRWVGVGRYSGSLEAMSDIPQPWIYVGWTYNPTVLNLKERLRWFGIGYVERMETNEMLMNHLAQSWIWDHDDLSLREIAVAGRYYGFQVSAQAETAPPHGREQGRGQDRRESKEALVVSHNDRKSTSERRADGSS